MNTSGSIPDVDDDAQLYLRNLVEQLTNDTQSSSSNSNSNSNSNSKSKTQLKSQSPTHHKKQVRRRLHTTRPYQERLLNMAEARKEIVTALKFHRATMKQNQQQLAPPPPLQSPLQPLGLSLGSYQDLTSLDAACLYSNSPYFMPPQVASPNQTLIQDLNDDEQLGLGSRALCDQEIEEMKSIGEIHEMEWNDTLNLANSAWWYKFVQDFDNLATTVVVDEQVVELPLLWEGGTHLVYSAYPNSNLPCMNIEEDIKGRPGR